MRFRHADGSWRDLEVRGTNLLAQSGIEAIVLASRDVTERKRLEREADAQRGAVARSERLSALGVLVAGVAHEINNPLTYIRGNIKLAPETLPAVEAEHTGRGDERALDLVDVREGLASALAGSDRIGHIVKALRAVARKTDGRRERLDLREVLDGVETLVRAGVPEGVELAFEPAEDALPVRANAAEMHQVLLNLVKNPLDALGEAGRIRVACRSSGGHAEVVVEDDGPGVPDEVRGKLFTPFLTTKPAGTGLGLSIVHGIVKDHGGDIVLDAGTPRGARFVVRLPLAS